MGRVRRSTPSGSAVPAGIAAEAATAARGRKGCDVRLEMCVPCIKEGICCQVPFCICGPGRRLACDVSLQQ